MKVISSGGVRRAHGIPIDSESGAWLGAGGRGGGGFWSA